MRVCVCIYIYIHNHTHTFIANINTCRKYIRDSKFKRHKHRSPRAGLGLGTLHQLLKPPKKEATPEVTSIMELGEPVEVDDVGDMIEIYPLVMST